MNYKMIFKKFCSRFVKKVGKYLLLQKQNVTEAVKNMYLKFERFSDAFLLLLFLRSEENYLKIIL